MTFFGKRINLIIRKKHLVLASLTLMLGVAVFAHFLISGNNNVVPADADAGGNYGDAQFVNKNDNNSGESKNLNKTDAYFVQARLDKQESRDKAAELLQSIYTGGDLNVDELQMVAKDAVDMSGLVESESKVETTLKAQGFEDVICYLNGKTANVIVKSADFGAADAAKVKDALISEIEIEPGNITIIPVK